MAKFINDTTLTRQGDNYQYIIALECCLNAQEGDIVFIEQRGDVATEDTSIEVKHHINDVAISDRDKEFWKTLKNWAENYEVVKNYKSLILLTTSRITSTSKLINWNNLDSKEKLKIITEIKDENTANGIQKYVDFVFNFTNLYTNNMLLDLLSKFFISSLEPNIHIKIEKILEREFFKPIPKKHRKKFFSVLLAYIRDEGMYNPDDWKIEITNFLSYVHDNIKNYVSENTTIPDSYKNLSVNPTDHQEYIFVKEIEKIEFNKKINEAIKDYFRTQLTINNDLANDYHFDSVMEDYEKELLRSLEVEKQKLELDLTLDNVIKLSQKCYLNGISMPLKSIKGYNNTETWFQCGTIHNIVNKEHFIWLLQNTNSQ
jgi:hypothetical protein